MTHINAIIRQMNNLADDIMDLEFAMRVLTCDITNMYHGVVPLFNDVRLAERSKDDIHQTTLGDFGING